MIKYLTAAAVAGSVMTSAGGQAATVIFNPGVFGAPAGYTLFSDFDSGASQALVTGNDFFFPTGDVADEGSALPGNLTPYLAVLGGGVANISFTDEVRAFSFDYSTVDVFNTVKINYADGGFEDVRGGRILSSGEASGQLSGSFIIEGDGRLISGLSLSTSSNSFEVDNLAFSALLGTVPEPATWGLMVVGFGMVGINLRRRPRATVTS